MNKLASCALSSLFALGACAGPDPAGSEANAPLEAPSVEPGLNASEVDYVFEPGSHVLKARNERLDLLTRPLKADQYDDIRNATPELHAITMPPANNANIRPMVEWEPMQAIAMQFPASMNFSDNAATTMAKIALHASTVADVWVVVDGNQAVNYFTQRMLGEGMSQQTIDQKVKFLQTTIDSIWFIDFGPVPIIDKTDDSWAFADFRYYHQRAYDDGVPTVLGRSLTDLGVANNTVTYRMPLSTEGGTFQSTTDGICFTGSRQLYYMSCAQGGCQNSINSANLADLQNHPLLQQMEQEWGDYLGCKDIIVTHSITDDGTGHIDMYLKVVDDNTVLVGEYMEPFENNAQQTNSARLDANAALIAAYVKPDGTSFDVERLVMPGHRSSNQGTVPFTYINSTFINGLNLWPATEYPDWVDSRNLAQSQWEAVMPEYDHIYIDSTELSFWSGAIHCITRTIPDGAPGLWVGDGTCGGENCSPPTGGYDGVCQPGSSGTDVCWGPQWECYCNDCALCPDGPIDPGPGPTGCNGVTYEGCCDGTTLSYCENGALQNVSCGGQGCGWVTQSNWYDCGGQGEDPSGTYPLQCPGECTPDCSGKVCGDDGCGGSCGSCGSGETCTAGECVPETCVPDCSGKACGSDGCGGACGTCDAGDVCTNFTCVTPSGGSCADIPADGQCDGDVATWCESDQVITFDCATIGKECAFLSGQGYTCVTPTGEDTGGATDTGGTEDTGGTVDAGPTDDTSTGEDTGGTVDAGPTEDVTGDGGGGGDVSGDGSANPDANVEAAPIVPSRRSGGCDAGGDGAPAAPIGLALALLVLVAWRRREDSV